MSKQVLGKGLGTLLGGDKIAGPGGSPAPAGKPVFGRGVETLLEAGADEERNPEGNDPGQIAESPNATLPAWYLFGADLILLLAAAALVLKSPRPISAAAAAGTGFCVLLGALLAVWGVFKNRPARIRLPSGTVPKWVAGQSEETGQLILHLQEPLALYRVRRNKLGDPFVTLVWIDPSAETPDRALAQLAKEAGEFFQNTENRAEQPVS